MSSSLSPAAGLPLHHPPPVLVPDEDGWVVRFQAMASPCEVLCAGVDADMAQELGHLAASEAWRLEAAFSRYLPDNPLARIHAAKGQRCVIDAEMFRLLSYAGLCHELSGGLFDITSGVLRRAWRFDGSDRIPGQDAIAALLPLIGWAKVRLGEDWIELPAGMELDLGGIGKEYAVDRVLLVLMDHLRNRVDTVGKPGGPAMLVNFGGDLVCSGPRAEGRPWRVGIESIWSDQAAVKVLAHSHGGVATSGDARRYLLRDGVRFGHILDPRTGWPIANAPRSVTVAAATCTLAGMLATFAMLHGAGAESFLDVQQGIRYWIQRQGGEKTA